MKKIAHIVLVIIFIGLGVAVIYVNFWPFASNFINSKLAVGDSYMHLANIATFQNHLSFPIKAWYSEFWAGYPVLEGYPWLHYYLIQPLLSFFSSSGLAMDYYSLFYLFFYYIVSFILLYRVSKNPFIALFFSLVLLFGADSGIPLYRMGFMTFTASLFFLPLLILLIIIAREKHSKRLLYISSILLAVSFYSHGALTGIVIIPAILPYLLIGTKGKITGGTIKNTIKYLTVFALLASIQIYQFLGYFLSGSNLSMSPHPLSDLWNRYLFMFSWQNPVLLPLLIIFIPIFVLAVIKKKFVGIKPYFFSFLAVYFFFTLMVLKITGMALVLLAERALWAVSLTFLILFASTIGELIKSKIKWSIMIGIIGLVLTGAYIYSSYYLKSSYLVPDYKKAMYPYTYYGSEVQEPEEKEEAEEDEKDVEVEEYENKYDYIYTFPPVSWNQEFDNYRVDAISYNIYSSWALMSENPRYKGRFPPLKDLPLHWSGLVSAAEYGQLGEGGTPDTSQWALNRALFFFDWYAIKHFQIGKGDAQLADYLRKEPLVTSTEKSKTLTYHSLDEKYVGPIYAPTNAKTIAFVGGEKQYDNFIRTLSYSNINSQNLIPLYLGSSLGALKEKDFENYDAIFLYGYKKYLTSFNIWDDLKKYVEGGGNLIIDTGQKVSETSSFELPAVFPVGRTKTSVVEQNWNAGLEKSDLLDGVEAKDFSPLTYKYLPYTISVSPADSKRSWSNSLITKDDTIALAYGELGEGKVAWSGLNMLFQAIDTRNLSEMVIVANIVDWFFPEEIGKVTDYEIELPQHEKIVVKGSQGKGILIKEHYNPGWSARVNGKKAKIYKAGLLLMYIPLESEGDFVLELNYNGAPIYWILFLITTTTLIGTITYIIIGRIPFKLPKKIQAKLRDTSDKDY
ncbi:hypothetical protein ACFL0F_01190 [Patescibacteria group bacterium]